VVSHQFQGIKKGVVFSGTFMGLLYTLGLLWQTPGLREMAADYPLAATTLAGALVFPLAKTIVESFDGSTAFFRRIAGLLQAGDLEGGLHKLAEAATLAPGDAVCQYNYGVGLLLASKIDEGIDRLRSAIRLDPSQGNAYYYVGRAQILKRNWSAAIQALEQALRLIRATMPFNAL
jgi:cyclic beta-1,2-glucan synthetase